MHRNGFQAHLSPPAIKVADTIGAGDAFSAGLLAYFADRGLLHPDGVATSAFTCTRPGGDPHDAEELEAFVAQHGPGTVTLPSQ